VLGNYKIMTNKYCARCTHEFNGEVKYFLLGGYYCEHCINEIKDDPDYLRVVRHLASMIQIED